MAKQPEKPPAGDALSELDQLRYQKADRKRAGRAWEIILQAVGSIEFPVVLDFALEQGLVHGCGDLSRNQPSPRWVNPVDGSEMVWIPPGPFYVGRKGQRLESKGFSLARFPVTNAQFAEFVEATDYSPPVEHPENHLFLSHWNKEKVPKGKEDHPVVWVSYVDALHYCRWAGLTLPTEWLWEKAARGPDRRMYPWGSEAPYSRSPYLRSHKVQLANVGSEGTCAVGKFSRTRTPYGCEDLIGNVSEWCQTTPNDDPTYFPEKLPDMPADLGIAVRHKVVRGSCFLRTVTQTMASSHRRRLAMTRRNYWTGFRSALLLPCRPAV